MVVDMSSIAPLAAKEVAAALAEKGVEMLDAPVSGGEPKAIDRHPCHYAGGKAEIFREGEAGPAQDGDLGRALRRDRERQRGPNSPTRSSWR